MLFWTFVFFSTFCTSFAASFVDPQALQIRKVPNIECPSSKCVRKCCPVDHVWDFVKAVCKKSPQIPENFTGNFFNQTFEDSPSIVTGNWCPAESEMIPQANFPDGYEPLDNGQVIISGRKLDVEDYCVDYVDSDGVLSKVLFICGFQRSLDQVLGDEDYATIEKIPLTKCCSESDSPVYFSPASKTCLQHNATENFWPLNALTANNIKIQLPEEAFNISYKLQCPPGFVPEASLQFQFYEDGTLSLTGKTERLSPGTFCLDALDDRDYPNPQGAFHVVQYCKPDPCKHGSVCVKKCCPDGYMCSTRNDELRCVSSAEKFSFQFRSENNVSVPSDSVKHVIRYGSFPNCANGKNLIDPEVYPEEFYYLLPQSGNLYVPGYPKDNEHQEYCIDNFDHDEAMRPRAFICFPPEEPMDPGIAVALSVYPYFMGFSVVFLVLTFLVYAMLPELQNLHGLTIMCHVFCLIVTFVGLCIIQTGGANHHTGFCISTAIVVHFFFLSTFTWLNVMGFDLWMTFSIRCDDQEALEFWLTYVVPHKKISTYELVLRNNRQPLSPSDDIDNEDAEGHGIISSPSEGETQSEGDMRPRSTPKFSSKMRRFAYYCCFAWGVPLVIVIVGQILDNAKNVPNSVVKPGFGVQKCWFIDNIALLCYFYGPVGLSILTNIAFFAMTAFKLYKASKEAAFATQNNGRKERFRIIVYLFVLMGVFWILEIVSFAAQGSSGYIWIVFDLFNILTGFFIFVIFVCKRQVIQLLRKRYGFFNRCWESATKNHPEWNRTTEPTSSVSTKHSTKSRNRNQTDTKREISTSVTNTNLHDSMSEFSDKETSNLNMKKL